MKKDNLSKDQMENELRGLRREVARLKKVEEKYRDIEKSAHVPSNLALVHLMDIAERRRMEEALRNNSQILKAVCSISEQFLRASSWKENHIHAVLKQLGLATGISHISIFENSISINGDPLTSPHYEWHAPDFSPKRNKKALQVFSWRDKGLRNWKKQLSRGKIIQGLVQDLPEDEKKILPSQDVKSFVVVPVFVGEKWWGLMIYSQCPNEREWSSTEIDALKTASDIFGVLIYRNEVRKEQQDSEKKFRNLSEEISDGVAVIINQKIHWVNNAFSEIFRSLREELLGEGLDAVINPEDLPELNRLIDESLAGQNIKTRCEVRAMRDDGVEITIDTTIKKIIFENKPGVQLLIRDVTEHMQVENALRESEERFRIIVQNAPFPISIFDATGVYLYTNKKFSEVFGYNLEDIPTGKRWFELAFPDPNYRKQAIAIWKCDLQKLRKGRMLPRQFRVYCKDGTVREIIFRPLSMNDDQIFVIYEDITDQKKAEAEVFKAKEHLEKVLNSVTDAIIVTDMNRRIITCNHATERIFGYQKAEIIGKRIRKLFPNKESFKGLVKDAIDDVIDHGYFDAEIMLMHKDAHLFPVSLISSLLVGADGKPTGIVAVVRDITERKQAEEAREKLEAYLRQAQKMEAIGTFAGGIAHDFNNILSVILGYAELTLDMMPEGVQAHSNMGEIIKACNRGKDLVRQILTFSRKVEQERRPVQIAPIIEESLRFLRASLPSTIQIRQEINSRDGVVSANPTQIHQIIMNLCSNAYHAMREKGGVLNVELSEVENDSHFQEVYQDLKESRYLKLSVIDSGHGIESSDMERIFDPFFTTKPLGEGTGMGLSTVHGIVKAHEGGITVDSKPGKGTTFDIYLPLLDQVEISKEFHSELNTLGRERVLFIDDEESIACVGKKALERLGYQVTALTSSVKAQEIFHREPEAFDIVITDQTLPYMTGMELARKLMKIRPKIPIILTTGFSELATKEKARELGIRDFIMKPFLIRDLAQAIRRIMDHESIF